MRQQRVSGRRTYRLRSAACSELAALEHNRSFLLPRAVERLLARPRWNRGYPGSWLHQESACQVSSSQFQNERVRPVPVSIPVSSDRSPPKASSIKADSVQTNWHLVTARTLPLVPLLTPGARRLK